MLMITFQEVDKTIIFKKTIVSITTLIYKSLRNNREKNKICNLLTEISLQNQLSEK